MRLTSSIVSMLKHYDSDSPGTRANLVRILMQGKLGGTGKLLILPVDQGFEHGPAKNFSSNPQAYDPEYHAELCLDAGLSAYAAPLGMIEIVASRYAGVIPLILKLNSSNSLIKKDSVPYQAITSSVKDALRLGCVGVGFTIYAGSDKSFDMMNELREIIFEAKSHGLIVVVWAYPRGGDISKQGETAIDICAYAAHIAALLGAHIIKLKPPTDFIEQNDLKNIYSNIKIDKLEDRIKHIMQSSFANKRIVVFSGGANRSIDDIYDEVKSIYNGGGNGSIIGRNSFQRPREEALDMLEKIINIYKGN